VLLILGRAIRQLFEPSSTLPPPNPASQKGNAAVNILLVLLSFDRKVVNKKDFASALCVGGFIFLQ